MILFDYDKIYLAALGDPSLILEYLPLIKGSSFLLRPEVLKRPPIKCTTQQLAEYIGICSFRDYVLYKATKDVSLPRNMLPPWVPFEVVEANPLIKANHTQILLPFEE